MKKRTPTYASYLGTLAEDARALVTATANVAGDKVVAARNRLSERLETAQDTYDHFREKAVAGVEAADESLREHPYKALGTAFGVGALIGILITRRQAA